MARSTWMSDAYRWNIPPLYDGAEKLAAELGTTSLVAQVLYNRGISDASGADAFLKPSLSRDLIDPLELDGCDRAAERIAAAVRKGERIVIYGDYDVDGMTASAILISCIRLCEGDVGFYVPHRLDEGYGLNREALEEITTGGADLIVTVDCGISAGDLVEEFSDRVDIIITDHHVLPDHLPDACAIVHPHVGKSYANANLCGAGVAFKLAWQVARKICGDNRVNDRMKQFLLEATTLAGLGTIADYVPLTGENHVIAMFGLRGIPAVENVGLKALLASAKLADARTIDAYQVGYVLAPRLNAAGRMGHASEAVELLTTDDPARAKEIAEYLGAENDRRRRIEQEITAQAVEMVNHQGLDAPSDRAIVLASDQWHGGVIGIVASRLVDRFRRPAVVMDIGEDGVTQGSARSIQGFHMAEALAACENHLISHGGHAMAGGMRIDAAEIEKFTAQFVDYANKRISDEQMLPCIEVEAETKIDALGFPVVQILESMAPFGPQNPRPLVVLRNCRLVGVPRRMGQRGETISIMLEQGTGAIRCVGFRMGTLPDYLLGAGTVDVVGRPNINEFQGRRTIELELKDVRRIDE